MLFSFHDLVTFEIKSDSAMITEFIKKNYSYLKKNSTTVDLKIFFYTNSNYVPSKLKFKISHNIYFEGNKVLFTNEGYSIILNRMKHYEVKIYLKKNIMNKILFFNNRYIKLNKLNSLLYERIFTAIKLSITLPLLYKLQQESFLLLHGAAIEKNDESIIFTGGNGVGKSTFILNLISRYKYKFLTEDYIILKDLKIYPFIERLRLSKETITANTNILSNDITPFTIYNKYHISIKREKIGGISNIKKVFWVILGPTFFIKKVRKMDLINRINNIHNYLHEFPENSYLALNIDQPNMFTDKINKLIYNPNIESYLLCLSNNHVKNLQSFHNFIDKK